MQNWSTNDQKIDQFNSNNPLNADKFCDDLHRYWSMKFKDEKATKNKDKNKSKGDNTRQQNSQKSLVQQQCRPYWQQHVAAGP